MKAIAVRLVADGELTDEDVFRVWCRDGQGRVYHRPDRGPGGAHKAYRAAIQRRGRWTQVLLLCRTCRTGDLFLADMLNIQRLPPLRR